MSSINKMRVAEKNHEGTVVPRLKPEQELRRSVMACMLWEDSFYESGEAIIERIKGLMAKCRPYAVADMAIEAREDMKLRHIPLFLIRELARPQYKAHSVIGETLSRIIQRPDELTEFLAIYWKEKKEPLSAQVKKGLASAFQKFTEYQLAKYNRLDKSVKLRDVLFLCHAKPKDKAQERLWKRLIKGELKTPDTWEVALSAGKDKKKTWERLMKKEDLGALALLRNLRNMIGVDVDKDVIREAIGKMKTERVLPFRFIAAAKYAPALEPDLEKAMFRCLEGQEKLAGKTALVVDTSPSMWQANISQRSEMTRFEAAAALAILARETCEDVAVYAFNEKGYVVPARRGFALRDALEQTQGSASCGGAAVEMANKDGYDRIIIITDGEWHYWPLRGLGTDGNAQDVSPDPLTSKAYMVNVATDRNGIGYGKWNSIDGWSESILNYIRESEKELP